VIANNTLYKGCENIEGNPSDIVKIETVKEVRKYESAITIGKNNTRLTISFIN
jgi:hypothetical protein